MSEIEWNSDEGHRVASDWLTASYKYITEDRNKLQDELADAYNKVDYRSKSSYEEKYADVIRLENSIDEQDKSVIIGLANYRKYLWS